MGATTISIQVSESDVAPDTQAGSSGYRVFGNYMGRDTKARRIVSAAIELWQMGDHDRNGSPYADNPIMMDPKPIEMVQHLHIMTMSRSDAPIVPLIDKRDYEVKTKNLTVKLDDAEWQEYMSGNKWNFLEEKVAKMCPELAGKISNVKLDTGGVKYYNDVTPFWTVRSTVKADTSGGKAKTVYTLLVNNAPYQSPRDEFPTQAAARAAGEKLMTENLSVNTVDVQAKIVREDNTAVVKIRRKVSSATAKVVVEYIKMKTDTPRTDGWMVAFSYHT